MANKITLDFDKNIIIWDTEHQQGIEHCDDLSERKGAILKAMGYEEVNVSPVIHALEDFLNGEISGEELQETMNNFEDE